MKTRRVELTEASDGCERRLGEVSTSPGGGRAAPSELPGLLRRVAEGDRDAFAELYDTTAAHLYGLVHSVVRDSTRAEDVTHESYLEIWRSSTRFEPESGSVLSRMLSLAHRRAVDAVRATDRAARPHHVPGHIPQGAELPGTAEVARVGDALAQLPTSQRQALELTYFAGHTYLQLSEETGVPPGAAASDLREGLLRLRDALLDPG